MSRSVERVDNHVLTTSLANWLEGNGILGVAFDLDDTLLNTHELFGVGLNRAIAYVNESGAVSDIYGFVEELRAAINNAFIEYKVSPNLWPWVFRHVVYSYPDIPSEVTDKSVDELEKIYQTVPEFLPGAQEALSIFTSTGTLLMLGTHSNLNWAKLKVDEYYLDDIFSPILVVDENKHKGQEDWQELIGMVDLSPRQVAVFGDNKEGDIIAAKKAGVERLIYIDEKAWSVYKSGKLPGGTIIARSVMNFLYQVRTGKFDVVGEST